MASTSKLPDVFNLPDLVDYFMSASNVSEQDDIIQLINTKDLAIEYQGFDPKVILSQMIRNRKSYESQKPAKIEWDLRNVGGDLKVNDSTKDADRFSNYESLSRDVIFLITVFLSRNHHINKIVKKARGGVEDVLNMLKEKYNIDDKVNKSGTSLESRTITLPRIAHVFPGTAVRMFHDRVVKEIVSYESFPGATKPSTHAICCPLLPSVCPTKLVAKDGNNFHPVMIWTAIRLDEIIHGKHKEFTPLIELLRYYRAAHQSAAVPEKSRVAIFSLLGLLKTNESKVPIDPLHLDNSAAALSSACHNSLNQMRTNDENHDLMLRVAKTGDMTLF